MRIYFPSLVRPKKATQKIAKNLRKINLSKVRESISDALGYSDWHDLEQCHNEMPPTEFDQNWSVERFRDFYSTLAMQLLPYTQSRPSEILTALSSSHLAGDKQWSHDDHVAVLFSIWRHRGMIGSGRRMPGTVVRMKGKPITEFGYLTYYGYASHVLFDTGFGDCADFEVITPRHLPADFLPQRLWRPYGFWTLKDGSEVPFSRDYLPLWHVRNGKVHLIEPWLRIEDVQMETHFGAEIGHWMNVSKEADALKYMADRRIKGLPMLADVLPELLGHDANSVKAGVASLKKKSIALIAKGPWDSHYMGQH
ncbi:hypothetical protein [Asticcacaulis sp. AND118]|uniref:hypothetical protein n=1 Tax=Asticcacaulis sp. AND118 TaxID=2840468 RepID=UPI001CFFBE4F|nr:hypothetical protein [Asticcacaulis sp. AND118]UDF05356.1 hypothetical protein LH365_14195 [Asticcacaulis sp. AND118]